MNIEHRTSNIERLGEWELRGTPTLVLAVRWDRGEIPPDDRREIAVAIGELDERIARLVGQRDALRESLGGGEPSAESGEPERLESSVCSPEPDASGAAEPALRAPLALGRDHADAVLTALEARGPSTVAHLAVETGLPRSAVCAGLAHLASRWAARESKSGGVWRATVDGALYRFDKRQLGRELDGREWNEFPQPSEDK